MGLKVYIKLIGILVCLLAAAAGCSNQPDRDADTIDIARALSDGDAACYARANRPATLHFPQDFGPHTDFKTEWWYYTGNLLDRTGRHFGFQLTFFRQALACPAESDPGQWQSRQLYFAHFAVTDTLNRKFYSARRMNRGSMGIAGAMAVPFRVWLDNWQASGGQDLTRTLYARDRDTTGKTPFGIDLMLTPAKPVILQGRNGWSKKGPGPADASYYYSFPGMAARGRITLGPDTFEVTGRAWFDHEWSTSALSDQTAGWDWFNLHLDQGAARGTDLMLCQVRDKNGMPNGFGFGAISLADGRIKIMKETEFTITVQDKWKSPKTGIVYPAQWRIVIAKSNITLNIRPVMSDQEHKTGFVYYEGAVTARDDNANALGMGYVEMTGY